MHSCPEIAFLVQHAAIHGSTARSLEAAAVASFVKMEAGKRELRETETRHGVGKEALK